MCVCVCVGGGGGDNGKNYQYAHAHGNKPCDSYAHAKYSMHTLCYDHTVCYTAEQFVTWLMVRGGGLVATL